MSHPNLMEYHDGELSPPNRGEVERHLKICRECQQQLEEWRQLDDLVRGRPPALPRPRTGPIWLQAAVLLLTAGFALLQARPDLPTTTRHYEIHHGAQIYTVETSGANTTLLMLEIEDEDGLAQAHVGGENL